MARKKTQILFKLLSSAGSNYSYIAKKHYTKAASRLTCIKLDPVVGRHVLFGETKLASGRKK